MEIDLDALTYNYMSLSARLQPDCRMMPVLKADAYGLGAITLGKLYESLGAPMFSVATIDEAMALRKAGIQVPILLLGPTSPNCVSLAIEHNIHLALVSYQQAKAYSDIALSMRRRAIGHIKLDCGLGRLGIVVDNRLEEAVNEAQFIAALPGIEAVAMFTHITNSSLPGGYELDQNELDLFNRARKMFMEKTNSPLKSHCLSSSPLFQFTEYQFDYARVGALLMGSRPEENNRLDLKQAVSLKSKVFQVKELGKGAPISYGPIFVTLRPTRIALVALGYSTGLRRSLSNSGYMLLRGAKAPIIGKICCDYTTLDVTDIPGAKEGDIVTLMGTDGIYSQYACDLAELYPASVSEVTTCFGGKLQRTYRKSEK